MNEMYYEIDEKRRRVWRMRNGFILGSFTFSRVCTLRKAHEIKPLEREDHAFIYLIAYDELVDRGLIKENE